EVADHEKNVANDALATSQQNLILQEEATSRARDATMRANDATRRANDATRRAKHAEQVAKHASQGEKRAATRAAAQKDLATAQAQLPVTPAVRVRQALAAAATLPAAAMVPILRDSLAAMNVRRVIGGGSDPIRMIALSPDNTRFVAAGEADGASVF